MNKRHYIYKMTSPSNKVYIGITKNLSRRKSQHKQNAKNPSNRIKSRKIVQAIQKYGMDKMNFQCIATAFTQDDAKELERVLIEFYDSFTNGYNLTPGGDSITIKSNLNEKKVDEIRDLLENSEMSLQEIGDKFKISSASVLNIQIGKSWSDVGNYRKIIRKQNTFARGSSITNSKLTEEDVYEIKRLYMEEDIKSPELSKRFNMTRTNICDILKEKTWKHVKYEGFKKKKFRGNSKFKEVDIRNAWELKLKGYTIKEIELKLNIPYATLYSCFTGKNWKDLFEEYSNK